MTMLQKEMNRRYFLSLGLGVGAIGTVAGTTIWEVLKDDQGLKIVRESIAKHVSPKAASHGIISNFHQSLLKSAERLPEFKSQLKNLSNKDELEKFIVEEFYIRTNFIDYSQGQEQLSLLS